MVAYNPKDWFSFIFRFHRSDTFRKLLPAMVGIGAYAALVAFLETGYWRLTEANQVKNLGLMHGTLGFVISLLLVFRTNTAYERWWEGRKLWGDLVNTSRNMAIKLTAWSVPEKDRAYFAKMLALFARTLRDHLQGKGVDVAELKQHGLQAEFIRHAPSLVAGAMAKRATALYRARKISGEQLIILNNELQAFAAICGGCERIKNTPIPYSYSAFIKKFIFIYIMTMPLGYAVSLGFIVAPVVVFIFYVLASLELIAEEIEDPFGGDPNDLPLTRIVSEIQNSTVEILQQ